MELWFYFNDYCNFPISYSQARRRIWKRDVHFPTIGFEPLVEQFILCNF
jgi:hypothetical protein